jgi:hypothetical protein
MSERSTAHIGELLDSLYRVDSRRILATLIHLLGIKGSPAPDANID